MKLAIVSLIIAFTFGPCAPAGAPEGRTVALNQEFSIKVGESVSIERGGPKLTFVEVPDDSRCPEGVTCIWAGNGKVTLSVSVRGRTPGKINLNTMLEPKQESFDNYSIKLIKLDPYPKKDAGIKKSDYVATLVVGTK